LSLCYRGRRLFVSFGDRCGYWVVVRLIPYLLDSASVAVVTAVLD
jgi:hypothetical protein